MLLSRRLLLLSSASDAKHEVISLGINGLSYVHGREAQYTVSYNPSDTDETDVLWEITEGSSYASITQEGLLTINPNANNDIIVIKVTSMERSTVFTQKEVTVKYDVPVQSISISGESNVIGIKGTYTVQVLPQNASNKNVTWSITSGSQYAVINSETGVLSLRSNANNSQVIIRATSNENPSIYSEKTVTCTFVIPQWYIDTNGNSWTDSGSDTAQGWDIYQSNSNYHKALPTGSSTSNGGSTAKTTVHFSGYSEFTVYVRYNAYQYYYRNTPYPSYTTVGQLNKSLGWKYTSSGNNSNSRRGTYTGWTNQEIIMSGSPYSSQTEYTPVTFTNLTPTNEYTFDVVFVRGYNTGSTTYSDRAFLYIPYMNGDLTSITVEGVNEITNNYATYYITTTPAYTPLDTVTWSITNGSQYGTIGEGSGRLELNQGVENAEITIRATSIVKPDVYGEKQVTGTYTKAIESITVSGASIINDGQLTSQYTHEILPSDTTQTGVTWSIVQGAQYATINQNGLLTILEGADDSKVVIRCQSTANSDIYYEKSVLCTYVVNLISLNISGPESVIDPDYENEALFTALLNPSNTTQKNVGWEIYRGNDYATISNKGILTVKEGANNSEVIIRLRSQDNSSISTTKTIRVTHTSEEEIPDYFTIRTLTSFEATTARSETNDIIYRSTNAGQSKNEAVATVSFSGLPTIVLYGRSDAEAGYDYLVVGDLDKTPTRKVASDYANAEWDNVYYSFILNNTTDETDFTPIVYTNVDSASTHTVTLKFLKDDAYDRGADRGFFYVPKGENNPKANQKLKRLIIEGPSKVLLMTGNSEKYTVTYDPSYTVMTGVTWSITNGSDYAYIDSRTGELYATELANNSTVTIRATSNMKPSVYVERNITVTYTTFMYIMFEDSNVETICLNNFDNDNDGKISYEEAGNVTSLGSIFNGNSDITMFNELKYFTGLTSIPSNAFTRCAKLKEVTLPDTITSIATGSNNSGAFSNCTDLETVNIGPNITSIGNYSFYGSVNCNIYLKATTPPTSGQYAFGSSNAYISILFVPEESFSTYSSKSPYSTLNNNSRLKPWNP